MRHKCECRVCKLGKFLEQNTNEEFHDYYMSQNLILEGEMTEANEAYVIKKYKYNESFNTDFIMNTFELWKRD